MGDRREDVSPSRALRRDRCHLPLATSRPASGCSCLTPIWLEAKGWLTPALGGPARQYHHARQSAKRFAREPGAAVCVPSVRQVHSHIPAAGRLLNVQAFHDAGVLLRHRARPARPAHRHWWCAPVISELSSYSWWFGHCTAAASRPKASGSNSTRGASFRGWLNQGRLLGQCPIKDRPDHRPQHNPIRLQMSCRICVGFADTDRHHQASAVL